ncbi:MAG TPA: hypothetical protein VGO24_03540 [Solirubrobacterales bacterium]|jgi:hypothetical protein|nr:hypothetical protein [Solirubrobacterales bacterium]
MTGRKAIAGLCLLCALAFSALAAQNANAATKGTTLFTCKKTGPGGGFTQAHCKASDAGSGEYSHVAIAENTTTEITGTTEDTEGKPTVSKLGSVQAGVQEELQSKLGHILPEVGGVKSWVTNTKDATTGEHYFAGEAWVQYTEVTVTKPAGKGCVVKTGQVTTNKLKFTTKGQGDFVKFEPAAGEVFTEFEIEGCSIAALNGLYALKGSIKAERDGATLILTHANTTAQGTLTLRGQKMGFETTTTTKGTDLKAGDAVDTPLSVTTVETP